MSETTNTSMNTGHSGQENVYEIPGSEGIGPGGFALSVITLFLGWIPYLGWLMWALGLIFSLVGIRKKPKGIPIAGVVISVIGLVMLLTVYATVTKKLLI